MKRQFVGIALFLPLLACLLGASSITWPAGQPVPNPGGKAQLLEGAGTYAVDPNENFIAVVFFATETKSTQKSGMQSKNAKNGAWDSSLGLVAGNYDSEAEMFTTDKMGKTVINATKTVNVNVK